MTNSIHQKRAAIFGKNMLHVMFVRPYLCGECHDRTNNLEELIVALQCCFFLFVQSLGFQLLQLRLGTYTTMLQQTRSRVMSLNNGMALSYKILHIQTRKGIAAHLLLAG